MVDFFQIFVVFSEYLHFICNLFVQKEIENFWKDGIYFVMKNTLVFIAHNFRMLNQFSWTKFQISALGASHRSCWPAGLITLCHWRAGAFFLSRKLYRIHIKWIKMYWKALIVSVFMAVSVTLSSAMPQFLGKFTSEELWITNGEK